MAEPQATLKPPTTDPPRPPSPSIAPDDHLGYMRLALSLSHLSPPKPTNYRVGALLLSTTTNTLLSTSYTLELPGNTHAEQNCLTKLCLSRSLPESRVAEAFPVGEEVALYTTMEPCVRRLSGNVSCVERILGTRVAGGGVGKVFVGVREPGVFVEGNAGRRALVEGRVDVVDVHGLEEEILEAAMAGHKRGVKTGEVGDVDGV